MRERRNILNGPLPNTFYFLSSSWFHLLPLLPPLEKKVWGEILERRGEDNHLGVSSFAPRTWPSPVYPVIYPPAALGRSWLQHVAHPCADVIFELGCRGARWWSHVVQNLELTRVILCKLRQTHRIYGIFSAVCCKNNVIIVKIGITIIIIIY